jgi:hypothetical protein
LAAGPDRRGRDAGTADAAASFERDNNPVQMGPDSPKPKKTGPAGVREFIAEQATIGFDAVKLLMSNDDVFVEGGSMITQYSAEEAQAAGEQARESGVWLNCHAQAPESIKLAVRNGFRSVYHCTYADAEAVDLLEEHKDSIFLSPAVGIMWANVYEGAEYGIDTAVAEKMGSVKALRAATRHGGQVMDLPVGLLTPGYLADVLVVRGEPAQDVTVLQDRANLLAIMQNGAFYKLAGQAPGPRGRLRAGPGQGVPVGRLGRRSPGAAGRADRVRGAGGGGMVPGHGPGRPARRRGRRGRPARSRAGLAGGTAPRRARLGSARAGPPGQPGDLRARRGAADPAHARDGGRHGAGRAEHPAGRGAAPGRGERRAGTGAGRDALLEGRQQRARDHRALD